MEDTLLLQTNSIQTRIGEEEWKDLPQEIKEQFLEYTTTVPLISNLISYNRRRAIDLPKDKDGKIIVDLENPHILEDMDYFRPTALHYIKHGCYTLLRPNSNPNSEYGKWIREEIRRCYYGYVREEDGEWITGDYYFFLNYCLISLARPSEKDPNVTVRVVAPPNVWEGHYLRTHYLHKARSEGKHALELASRGKGKSYIGAALLAKRFVLGESEEVNKKVNCIVTASEKKYLTGANQILVMFQGYIDFLANNTQFPSRRITSTLTNMSWVMGYVDVITGTRKGTENAVTGVTSKDDESKLRGTRGVLYIIEESGTFPRLIKLFNVLRPSVEDGGKSFGIIYAYGTSGDSESDFHAMQEMMYNADGYNILSVKNVYDKHNSGKHKFSFFFPAYLNANGYYDSNGNSDVIGALLHILKDRYKVKYNSSDPSTIIKRTAEYPIVPQEAIINVSNSMFPVLDLNQRLLEIETDTTFYDKVYTGILSTTSSGKVEFKPTSDIPIRFFPHKDNKLEGAIEIYEMPEYDSSGKPIAGRYILSSDPYENDQSDTLSLGSIFVLDLWTDRIVAEYTGRPQFVDDFHEICRRMCIFYNGKLNYENNKKGTFAYFQRMNCLYLLEDTLQFLKDKQMIKIATFGNTAKGTPANAIINAYARDRIRNWLLTPVSVTENVDGEIKETTVPNLSFIKGKALLQELISYNSLGNFDRVSSLGMLMLYREDILSNNGGVLRRELGDDSSYLGNDPFFNIGNTPNKISY